MPSPSPAASHSALAATRSRSSPGRGRRRFRSRYRQGPHRPCPQRALAQLVVVHIDIHRRHPHKVFAKDCLLLDVLLCLVVWPTRSFACLRQTPETPSSHQPEWSTPSHSLPLVSCTCTRPVKPTMANFSRSCGVALYSVGWRGPVLSAGGEKRLGVRGGTTHEMIDMSAMGTAGGGIGRPSPQPHTGRAARHDYFTAAVAARHRTMPRE